LLNKSIYNEKLKNSSRAATIQCAQEHFSYCVAAHPRSLEGTLALKRPILIPSNAAIEKVRTGEIGLDEVFTSCDSAVLLLVSEAVWNELRADVSLDKFFMQNPMNCLLVNVPFILHLV
jgi:hypothetical protein